MTRRRQLMNDTSAINGRGGRRGPAGSALGLVAVGAAAVALAGANQASQEKPTTETNDCANTDCHPGLLSRPVMHRPAAQGQCLDCHEFDEPAEHRFNLVVPAEELCWECHDVGDEDVVHKPVDEGNCLACHDPHGSDHTSMLVKDPTRGLCVGCHDLGLHDKRFVHGPVAAQGCLACHDAHESTHDSLLTNTPTEQCLSCHTEMSLSGPRARHRHQALDDGCVKCHDAHATNFRFQLRSRTPQLCFSCHDDLRQALGNAAVVHGPVLAEGGCESCHSPHVSPAPHLLTMPQGDLCLTCHNKPIRTGDGRTLTDLATRLKEQPNLHGPVRDGNCAACHQPHAGAHARLLTEEYPPDFYAPFEFERYELCFGCHLEELVEDESGTGLTGFRQGDLNLHWLHVNQRKGRTCRACHEIHASGQPFHIREAVPFGDAGWMLKLNFQQTADGGSCAPGCHQAETYSRSAPEPE
jgi:predicted CXXCH cytochrome family protein